MSAVFVEEETSFLTTLLAEVVTDVASVTFLFFKGDLWLAAFLFCLVL